MLSLRKIVRFKKKLGRKCDLFHAKYYFPPISCFFGLEAAGSTAKQDYSSENNTLRSVTLTVLTLKQGTKILTHHRDENVCIGRSETTVQLFYSMHGRMNVIFHDSMQLFVCGQKSRSTD